MSHSRVKVVRIEEYDSKHIQENLPNSIFDIINKGDKVVLKPNWVKESHQKKISEWEYVITHPSIITAVILKVIEKLGCSGELRVIDGPQFDSSFEKIISYYPVDYWKEIAFSNNIKFEIIDLRDEYYIMEDEVIIKKKKLLGDPRGSVQYNLTNDTSEFFGHRKSKRGYFGAYYDINETNKAHNGNDNLYKVSKSVIDCDVFVNLPKLKTHKKAGITCCLKNLVGINTYRNFLPHHSEGGPSESGDQFPEENLNSRIEGPIMAWVKQNLIQNEAMAKMFKPVKRIGRYLFGDTSEVVRSGNWYGNDTIWRTVIDLNKILLYGETSGTLRDDNWGKTKKYIGIVDGIIGGEGNGPMMPDPVKMGYVICGNNPVAIDAVCAKLMGFNPLKIPSISNSFDINKYPICDFAYHDICLEVKNNSFQIDETPSGMVVPFKPHFGWENYLND